jgi:mono/diheme cytochrome c family protein
MTGTRKHLTLTIFIAALATIMVAATFTVAQQTKPANPNTTKPNTNVSGNAARGKYIVEDVAYCQNCHTPRLPNGQFDRSRWLQGGSLFFLPGHPLADWPIIAPRIGGNPPASDAQMVTLLMTGLWTDGKPLRQPMPQFRMNKEDAEAVVAYLKSMKNSNSGQ